VPNKRARRPTRGKDAIGIAESRGRDAWHCEYAKGRESTCERERDRERERERERERRKLRVDRRQTR